jgi:hypothetical protein
MSLESILLLEGCSNSRRFFLDEVAFIGESLSYAPR